MNLAPELAGLLQDNAALHRIYPLLDGATDWGAAVRAGAADAETIGARATHGAIRASSTDLATVLAKLAEMAGTDSTALEAELRRSEGVMRDPSTPKAGRDIELLRQQLLRHRLRALTPSPDHGIPRIVHLVRTDDGTNDLPLMQALCYRSIVEQCRGYRVVLHTPTVPQGPRWASLLPRLELNVAQTPQWLGNRRLVAAAHQSDVWRVKQLIAHGGFYFDWDLFLLRAPEALRKNVCVMALERQEEGYVEVLGVSAIGAEPGAVFLHAWLDEMPAVYNPRRYTSHSVVLAQQLAIRLAPLVRVLDYRSFYDPGWSEEAMRWLFDPAECLSDEALAQRLAASTGIHLFCSHANFLHWAAAMTERDIETGRCNLARLMRPYL